MPFPIDPAEREPKGGHNRRLALGLDIGMFAALSNLTKDQIHDYEATSPGRDFDLNVARLYGEALEKLERNPPSAQIVKT